MVRFISFWFCLLCVAIGISLQGNAATPPAIRIWPLGDSITWGCCSGTPVEGGYRTRLYTQLIQAGYSVDFLGTLSDQNPPPELPDPDHEGHGGYRTDELDAGLNTWLTQIDDPDVILLLIGTNDYWQGFDTANAASRLDAIITHLATARPYAKIIVANLLLFTYDPAVDNAIQTSYNSQIPTIVDAHKNLGQQVTFLDLRSCCGAGDLFDGVHPTLTGYSKVGDKWFSAITSVISPLGTANPPAILRAKGQVDLRHVAITFSKPVSDSSAQVGNFSLTGGLSVLGASLDSSKRVITLTTSLQAINTSYTVTVNGVTDRTAQANAIVPNSQVGFQSGPVPEAANYSLAYSLKVGNQVDYNSDGVPYTVDNSGSLGAFSRMAFYLELQPAGGGAAQYVWASMNAFTSDPGRLGVPRVWIGAFFQQNVTSLNVRSSVPGLVTGDGLTGGNVEFWAADYGPSNLAAVTGASDTLYDWGDGAIFGDPAGYGSMQLHNRSSGQTIFALNGWGGAGLPLDIGIGNSGGSGQSDWTLAQNATSYGSKLLEVYVLPASSPVGVPVITTHPSSLTVGAGGNATFTVVASGAAGYQWRRNGTPINGAIGSSYTVSNAQVANAGSYDVIVSNANGAVTSKAAVLTVTQSGILENGSFESGNSGWMTSGNQVVYSGTPYQASDGSYLVVFNGGNTTPNGIVLQSFATVPGQSYTLKFDVGVIAYNTSEQRLRFFVQGASLLVSDTIALSGLGNGTTKWVPQTYGFIANSSVTTVTFQDVSAATVAVDLLLDNVRVTSSGAPVITSQPSSVTVTVGGSASFSVVANGPGTLSYQWRLNGTTLNGATGSTLNLSNIQANQAGNYDVVVSNSSGSVTSNVAILTVIQAGGLTNGSFESDLAAWTGSGNLTAYSGAPYVASDGAKLVVFNGGQSTPNGVLSQSFATTAGQTYTLSFDVGVIAYNYNEQRVQVTVQGSSTLVSQTVSVFGIGNGTTAYSTRSYNFLADSSGVTLTFRDVSPTSQDLDLVLDNVRVTVASVPPPTITTQPSNTSAPVGGTASFSVVASGTGTLTYQWRFNTAPINGATASTYTLSNVQASQAGSYDVIVSNSGGPVTSTAATLTVTQPSQLVNGSFESNLTSWTATGNLSIGTPPQYPTTDGTKVLVFNDGQRTPNGVVSQSVSTIAGQTYTLTFDVGVIAWNFNEQRMQVTVQGSGTLVSQTISLFGIGNGGTKYTNKSYSFVADAAAVTLTFRDVSLVTDSEDLLLDHVQLTSAAQVQRSLSVGSLNPASGVTVTASPSDVNSTTSGVTTFGLTYANGTTVTLTAPASVNGNLFQKWTRNGADFSANASTQVTMDANYTMVAVYVTPTRTLTLNSSNPASGVTVTLNPAANGGTTSGATPYGVAYPNGTLVTVTAPATVGANTFQKWTRNGADFSVNASTQITMDADYTLTAVYVTPTRTLTVNSSSPSSGVTVTLSPAANGGTTSGVTSYSVTYPNGTAVTLTAPASVSGNAFQKWTRNGVDFSVNASTQVTMDANYTMVAIYAAPNRTLTLNSSNPASGVTVTLSPAANGGTTSGATPYNVSYPNGTLVTVTAPATVGTSTFQKWTRNGSDFSINASTSITMDADYTLVAVYVTPNRTLTLNSSNPASGVTVTLSPAANGGTTSGATPYNVSYPNGTLVTVTAPATVGTSTFQKWTRNGSDFSVNASTPLTMDADYTLVAVYAPNRTLSVSASGLSSSITVNLSPAAIGGAASGQTPFNVTYVNATLVTLSAPSTVGSYTFQKWTRNGSDFSVNASTQVTMDADYALVAVYAPPRTLSLGSVNPASGVSIGLSPASLEGTSSSQTSFSVSYRNGALVTVTAPTTVQANTFQKWQRDGIDFSTSTSAQVTMDANHAMTAVYVIPTRTLTVKSASPNNGISVTVSPADLNGSTTGSTTFTRSYLNNTSVTLTAPSSSGRNQFAKWQRDGVDYATTLQTSVTMDANHTMTAVFSKR